MTFHPGELEGDELPIDDYVNRLFLRDTDDIDLDDDMVHEVALAWYKLGASTVLAEVAEHLPDGELAPLLRRLIPSLVARVE